MMLDVIVVGAGLAGLTAARDIKKTGKSVLLLEARERVGGRLYTQDWHDIWADLGGQWVGPGQNHILALIDELGLEIFPTYDQGKTTLLWRGKKSYYSGLFPKINPLHLADFGQAQAKFDKLAKTVPLDAPWKTKNAENLDSETFQSWIDRATWTQSAKDLFHLYTTSVFACEPKDISTLHAAFYTHAGHGTENLASIANGAQESRVVGGTGQICDALAEQLGDTVRLSHPVTKVEQDDKSVSVHAQGQIFQAKSLIIAVPPALTGEIAFTPALPVKRQQLIKRTPLGSVIKAMTYYDKPFWRDEGLSGEVVSDEGPVRVMFDNSPPDARCGVLIGFFEGADARQYSDKTQQERQNAFIECAVRAFGEEARNAKDYIELDWAAEQYSGGCYGTLFGPGVWSEYGPELAKPVGRIHWAGTDIAGEWNGYMDGAIATGHRAAKEALSNI